MKNIIFCLILLSLFTWNLQLSCQTVEASSGVDKNSFQFELESIYLVEREGQDKVLSWSIPNALVRYGVSNNVEVLFLVPFVQQYEYSLKELKNSSFLFESLQLGVSINLWKQSGFIPEACAMYRSFLPVENFSINTTGHLLGLNFSNRLNDKFLLTYNFGYLSDPQERSGFYILNLACDLTKTTHCFVELFGSKFDSSKSKNMINTGIGFNLTSDIALDFSMATGLDHDMLFVGGKLSYVLGI